MMDQLTFTPQLGLIVGGIVGLLVGWIIGFFDSNNRTASKIQAAEANAEIAIKEAEKKIAEANEQIGQSAGLVKDDPGLLRLKNDSGRYALEMDGTPIAGVLSPDGKKRLIELLTVIRPYLEGGLPPQPPAVAPSRSVTPTNSVAPPAAPVATPVAPPAASVNRNAVPTNPVTPPAVPVSQNAIPTYAAQPSASAPETKKPEDDKAGKDLSIVAQIDSVLQERLLNTTLVKRGIRLSESPEGGVEVYVGLEKFEAVDDVTDPEVKAVIRAAIAAWEKKYTPGL